MKYLLIISTNFWLFVLFLTGTGTTTAQQVVSTAGDYTGNSAVQMSWTIGEVVTTTVNSEDNILTQGFHQSRITITAIDKLIDLGFGISAFPNPASESVILRFDHMPDKQTDWLGKDYYFQLYDLSGKLLIYKHIEDMETVILMASFIPSTYFLKIIKNNKEIRTFKIIKQ